MDIKIFICFVPATTNVYSFPVEWDGREAPASASKPSSFRGIQKHVILKFGQVDRHLLSSLPFPQHSCLSHRLVRQSCWPHPLSTGGLLVTFHQLCWLRIELSLLRFLILHLFSRCIPSPSLPELGVELRMGSDKTQTLMPY